MRKTFEIYFSNTIIDTCTWKRASLEVIRLFYNNCTIRNNRTLDHIFYALFYYISFVINQSSFDLVKFERSLRYKSKLFFRILIQRSHSGCPNGVWRHLKTYSDVRWRSTSEIVFLYTIFLYREHSIIRQFWHQTQPLQY